MHTKKLYTLFKRWMQFRVGAIPRLPKLSFMVTKGLAFIFNLQANFAKTDKNNVLMYNFYPCFSGEEGQIQSPSRPTPPPYRSSNGFQGDAPHGNIFR